MSQINMNNGQKSFWQRPEGIPGAIILIGIVGGIGYLLMKWMPTLIQLAENVLYLGAMCAVLFGALYLALDTRVRTLVWYFYKSMIRKVTGVFIQLDPVAIIEGFLEDLRDKMNKMEEQIGSLKGQIRKIKQKIDDKNSKVEYYYSMSEAALRMGDEATRNLNLRKAEREKDASKKFEILRDKTEKLYIVLDKMKRYSGIMVDDIAHEIEIKKEEREIIRTSHSVMKSAVNIINGNSDRKVLFDQAMEFIVDDIGMRIGEMERFMDVSADFMNNMDLENAMHEEKGLKALEEWVNKVDEKFDATKYQSPVKVAEQSGSIKSGAVAFKEKEKVSVNQRNIDNSNSRSKYF